MTDLIVPPLTTPFHPLYSPIKEGWERVTEKDSDNIFLAHQMYNKRKILCFIDQIESQSKAIFFVRPACLPPPIAKKTK